jgi:hypothetical protein
MPALPMPTPQLPVVVVSAADFDRALAQWAVIDEALVAISELGRAPLPDERLDRYGFTAYVEALYSQEFDEDPFETLADLELPNTYATEAEAWQAIQGFYASRGCVLLKVGADNPDNPDADNAGFEEFIVGEELLRYVLANEVGLN